jgi:hypothetical protein
MVLTDQGGKLMKLPRKFVERVVAKFKSFQTVALAQRDRDVSEADTVTVVKDVLAELFGFDKYTELTSEQQIRGTFCDLAIKIDNKIRVLIEVKSAGTVLNDAHLRQALNYGSNQGIEWVVLTNAVVWQLHKIAFTQPIASELVATLSMETAHPQKEEMQQVMYLFSREGLVANALSDYHERSLLVNRYVIGQILQTDVVANLVRKELRRLFEEVKIDSVQIQDIISNDVLKRDVVEGDKSKDAAARLKKAISRAARVEAKSRDHSATDTSASVQN